MMNAYCAYVIKNGVLLMRQPVLLQLTLHLSKDKLFNLHTIGVY